MRARVALSTLCLAAAACQGTIGEPVKQAPTGPVDPGVPPEPPAPPRCEPGGAPVPKLLRLSTFEYRNLVSDLLGVPVDERLFARWTPVAEVHGFDTMSETRIDQQGLEVQLDTAAALADVILGMPASTAHCPAPRPEEAPACAARGAYSARDDFSDVQARECWSYLDSSGAPMIFDIGRGLWRKDPDQTAFLWRDGAHPGQNVDVIRRWQAPLSGSVRLAGGFTDGDHGGGDGILAVIRHNDRDVFAQDVPNGGGTAYDLTLAVGVGDRVDFVIHRKRGPEWDSTAFTAQLTFTPTPRKVGWDWDGCAGPLVTRLGGRAFRRPLRPEELADHRALFESTVQAAAAAGLAEPAEEGLRAVLQALLLSPNLVFKPELVPGGFDEAERAHAVASRLALYFRSSIPDDALWTLASTGGLRDEATIRAEARRLLELDGERFATHFGGHWLAFRELPPGPLGEAMRREAIDVFAAVLAEDLPPSRLVRPGFTVVDAPLAAHYGLAVGEGPGPHRVETAERGGLLSQGTFLLRTANGTEFRRPIHRGLWVLTRLLCRTLPRVDPATREEIAASFGAIDPSLPLPEQMALHRDTSTRCGGCHAQIDPVGLALEKYDTQGLWRETYPSGAPIVTELELGGVVVRDPHELAAVLAVSPEFRACVGAKLLTFALNRGVEDDERCVAERLGDVLGGPSATLKDLAVEAFVRSLALTEVTP